MAIEEVLERLVVAVEHLAFGVDGKPGGKSAKTGSAPSSKPSAKSAAKTTVVGKQEPDPDAKDLTKLTKVELRAKLQEVQAAASPAVAKSILKQNGVSTLTQLDKSKYPIVWEQCEKAIADA
jgi:hypothetical protein